MKIVIVNTSDQGGGAEGVASFLGDSLREKGHHVTFLAGRAFRSDTTQLMGRFDWILGRVGHRIGFPDMVSMSAARFLRIEVVQQADIIHMHNLHGFYFGIAFLEEIAKQKKVVWTFHDMWGLTGGCYAPLSCSKWMNRCGSCPQHGIFPKNGIFDTSSVSLRIKRNALREILKRGICTGVSPWMTEQIKLAARTLDSDIGRVRMVRNCVDTSIFSPNRRVEGKGRCELGIEHDDFAVMMSAPNLSNWLKGSRVGFEAVRQLGCDRKVVLVLAGGNVSEDIIAYLEQTIRVISLGLITSRDQLGDAYRAVNVCLVPSVSESFSLVMAESLCCGTPVVATQVGGLADHIVPGENGELAEFTRVSDFERKLQRVADMAEYYTVNRPHISKCAHQIFDCERFTNQYLDIYEELLQ